MAMADRPDVPVASSALMASALAGLAGAIGASVATVPLRRPWEGPDTLLGNIGLSVTREALRTFMGGAVTLRTPELRSVEKALNALLKPVLPRLVARRGVEVEKAVVGGVPGLWYRRRDGERIGTTLYLHGGGYLATTPEMYAVFNAWMAASSYCELFVPDYRLAPEFPFPAALEDAFAVYEALLDQLDSADELFLAGDSAGGGLATSLLQWIAQRGLPRPVAVGLLSPQVSLVASDRSVVANADRDILPREIPVTPYLQGDIDPADAIVSAVNADPAQFPPLYVAIGQDEMLYDAVVRFVERVRAAGVHTILFDEPGMFHVYMILMPWLAASKRLYADYSERFAAFKEGRRALVEPLVGDVTRPRLASRKTRP